MMTMPVVIKMIAIIKDQRLFVRKNPNTDGGSEHDDMQCEGNNDKDEIDNSSNCGNS